MTRYTRQTILPEVGVAGQARLTSAHALIIGAGGLGHPVAQYLTGAGVGRITIVDPDTVELSNLHRQTAFAETDAGQPKARALCDHLTLLNSEVTLDPLITTLDPQTTPALVASADIVLDCADSFAVTYILSDECLRQNTPLISASVLEFGGYVGGFCATAPSIRAVFPDLPNRLATCATAGVMGPVVGTIGAYQAQMALAVLLGTTPSPLGQLISIDLKTYRNSGFRFDGAPEPSTTLEFIAPQAVKPKDYVVDLRGIEEAPTPITPAALRYVVEDFDTIQPRPQAGQCAILTCRSGLRAWQAARKLQRYWDGDIRLIAMGDAAPAQT